MAGDWIKWVKGLSRRAEVFAIARRLSTDRRIVACACMELWEWADGQTTDGHLPQVTPDFIDELVGLQGFFGAVEAAGWARSKDGGITLARWDRHNGDDAKRRARNAKNQGTKRGRPPDVIKMSPAHGDSYLIFFSLPSALNTETFRKEWLRYVEHRKQNRLRVLKEESVISKWKEMEKWGEARAIEAIKASISNGWQGVFEPKTNGAPKPESTKVTTETLDHRRAARQWLRIDGERCRNAIVKFQSATGSKGLDDIQIEQHPSFQDWIYTEMIQCHAPLLNGH